MNSISIAMATYNGGRHIHRQLGTLTSQTQSPTELVITDDCSNDDTISIVESFSRTASFPVRVFRNETRLGYRKNFMRAASLCQSELIAFCDQDDYWYPHKIATSVKPFANSDVLLVYHNADVITPTSKRIGSLIEREPRQKILPSMSSGPWLHGLGFTQIFRQSLLPWSNLWPQSLDQDHYGQPLAHDQWYFFLASVFGTIVYLEEPLVGYVQHEENTYGWRAPGGLEQFVQKHFHNHSQRLAHVAVASQRRAEILEMAKNNIGGVWRERITTAIPRYQRLSTYYTLRSKLYTSPKLPDRIKAYLALLRNGGYSRGPWTLGRACLLADLCPGVFFGHRLTPSTYWLG